MNQTELEMRLSQLKIDITERINSRGMLQAIINKHIHTINTCIDQNVTIKLIHENIFPNGDISFIHFKNLIYRARRSNKKISREVLENKNSTNPLSAFSTSEQLHNNSSDKDAAEERLNKLLNKKQGLKK